MSLVRFRGLEAKELSKARNADCLPSTHSANSKLHQSSADWRIGFKATVQLEWTSSKMEQGMSAKVARRFFVRGDVQGVGYRFFAQRAAAKHQIVGYVRNLPDGNVEVLAEGPAKAVEDFKHDLATGPQWATVTQVEEINLEPTGRYSSFRIES